ncbi:MAG: adenine phosphoribosyltransferase [Deltaproteobacteria bacterium]|nr:adenine phosphoribosyltransferase [Deltaproteobacteria bacterium]
MNKTTPSAPPLSEALQRARRLVRDVPDFPKKGILFRDVTPLLQDGAAVRDVVTAMAAPWRGQVDVVAGMESRGFIFGVGLALELGVGFIPVRKKGKLPFKTESIQYGLEYGSDQLEIHLDACRSNQRVLVCDDLIATGGTAQATAQLIERVGGIVAGYAFLIELRELEGRKRLGNRRADALFVY